MSGNDPLIGSGFAEMCREWAKSESTPEKEREREQARNRAKAEDERSYSQGTKRYVLVQQEGSRMVATPIDTLYGASRKLRGEGPNSRVAIAELRFAYANELVSARLMPDLATARAYAAKFEFVVSSESHLINV